MFYFGEKIYRKIDAGAWWIFIRTVQQNLFTTTVKYLYLI